jgi:hypothetical protein
MGEEREVSALGESASIIDTAKVRAEKRAPQKVAEHAVEYVISSSLDGVSFTPCAEGLFRSFAGEETVSFSPVKARYIRLQIISNAGKFSDIPEYANAGIEMAEITLF